MKRVMAACFWICLTCIVAGAATALLLVWKLVTGDEVYQTLQTVGIVFLAAAVTLAVGRTYLGKDSGA